MELTKQIKNYILYLKTELGLYVTLHPYGNERVIMPTELSTFNIHDNSYCIFAKSCNDFYEHCISCQKKVREKVKEGSFVGTCHAGVKEFVYPIIDGDTNSGFVSVSGYQSSQGESYVKRISQKYSLPYNQLKDVYNSLKEEAPQKEWVDSIINPLMRMLELAYLKDKDRPSREVTFTDNVVAYINRHRSEDITSEDICHRFSCSRSYMSGHFNQDVGMTVREYITQLRIGDAKQLLKFSNISITEIAMTVGYTDSNYFTSLFKRKVGVTPSNYRKNEKKT
ncbi:MAG: helix-turn-helix domain-containing protein [Clostridia bacterium]|nr:helix-turn-helix domain-containing protein [Clostridia bacterium]